VTPVLPRSRELLRLLAPVEPRLLSVRDVAQRLRVSKATVYALVGAGQLPHLRVSNAIRVRAEDLVTFILGGRSHVKRDSRGGKGI
jgi:excisionase family DNA binding protein